MERSQVVCIGLATVDTIVDLPAWPPRDGRVVADAIVRSHGGPAATAAVTLARLGHRPTLVAAVGDDRPGREIRDALAAAGVDVSHLQVLDGTTAESVILLDRSERTRTILHRPGAAPPTLDERARRVAADASWVHVDHVGHAAASGLDPARLSWDEGHPIERLDLAGVGIYAPSLDALRTRYPGRPVTAAVREALERGAARVVVTLGADGALAADHSGAWRVSGVRVESASTLGAGDVFHGALLASLLDGLSLPQATRRANVAAALSTRALDGRGAIPDRRELDEALRDAPPVEPVVLESPR